MTVIRRLSIGRHIRDRARRWRNSAADAPALSSPATGRSATPFDIAPDDPLRAALVSSDGVVDVNSLSIQSPALAAMRAAGMELIVPLVSQGTLVGAIVLGPREGEQQYVVDDRRMLGALGTHAAPAVRVAQLIRRQQRDARERERIEQELRIARLIQQTLLPKTTPALPGWTIATHYQPARAVGGDFYDFYYFDDGRIGVVIGDVTDKGVPAALVMATTRAILRSSSLHENSPGAMLQRANDMLYPDMPAKMFVTCFCACFDPQTGTLVFANAGHDIPYRRTGAGVTELRARGMPLGLLPGMQYEEDEITLAPGQTIVFYSDGLVEAHAPDGTMFGFPRLQSLLGAYHGEHSLVDYLLGELQTFTGAGWEQEDDVTLVTLEWSSPE